jgi:hypothetical protein
MAAVAQASVRAGITLRQRSMGIIPVKLSAKEPLRRIIQKKMFLMY